MILKRFSGHYIKQRIHINRLKPYTPLQRPVDVPPNIEDIEFESGFLDDDDEETVVVEESKVLDSNQPTFDIDRVTDTTTFRDNLQKRD